MDFASAWYISEPGTQKPVGLEHCGRTGPPSGAGPVRSIRKSIVLPGSGPTDLYYGKNVTIMILPVVEVSRPGTGLNEPAGSVQVFRAGKKLHLGVRSIPLFNTRCSLDSVNTRCSLDSLIP